MACAVSSSGLQCTLDEFELIDDDRLFIEQIFSLQAQAQHGEEYFDDEDLFMTFGCGGVLDFQGYEGIAMDVCLLEDPLPCENLLLCENSPPGDDQLDWMSSTIVATAAIDNEPGAGENQDVEIATDRETELALCYTSEVPAAALRGAEDETDGAAAASDVLNPRAVELGLEPDRLPEKVKPVRTESHTKGQEDAGVSSSSNRVFPRLEVCQCSDRQTEPLCNSRCLHTPLRGYSAVNRRGSDIDNVAHGRGCETAGSPRYLRAETLKRRRTDRVGADITNLDIKRQDCGLLADKHCGFPVPAKENSHVRAGLRGFKANPAAVDLSHKYVLPSEKSVPPAKRPQETDFHRLSQRQKQIDYGKNTLGYERYLQDVPRHKRRKEDPGTPDAKQICSKRSWDGQIRKWRRLLHSYDSPELGEDPTSVNNISCQLKLI